MKENGEPARLLRYRYTEIWVELRWVLDCRDAAVLGLGEADLYDDRDYRVPQLVALAGRHLGAEALLVRPASGMGDNLVIFPDLRRDDSVLEALRSLDPRLPSPGSARS